jgi:hypothetical protein
MSLLKIRQAKPALLGLVAMEKLKSQKIYRPTKLSLSNLYISHYLDLW